MKKFSHLSAIHLGLQIIKMQEDFPTFHYSRSNNLPTWHGIIQPTPLSPNYRVKIVYRYDNSFSKSPNVWILSPDIRHNAPHRYSDNSLCLYFPNDKSWTPNKFISTPIIPWTSLWLAFYEIWLETDYWYGPEAPHKKNKPKRK